MRAQFVLSEIGIGVRRNLTMTLAVIITVAISLSLFGAGLLIRQQVNLMKGYWYDRIEVSVFLEDDISPDQRDEIQRDLDTMPQVQQVYYESKEQAYERFKEQFKESPELWENVPADALPESFRVKLVDPEQFEIVSSAFRDRPGVELVQDSQKLLERFFRVLNFLRNAALFVAIVQILAAAVLISNTIRVAAFSRRRETGIMRLVGASNFYIQLPFLLEGALAGLIGAGLASLAVVSLKVFVVDRITTSDLPLIGWDAVITVIPVLILIGVLLSAVASFVTLRKYLRV